MPSRRAGRSSGSASACSCCSTAPTKTPRRAGSASSPDRSTLLPDGVKQPQMQWNVLDVVRPSPMLDGPRGQGVGVLRRTRTCRRPTTPRPSSPRATTAATVVAAVETAATCSRPSSTRRSRAPRVFGSSRTSSTWRAAGDAMDLYPSIDLRAGQVRAALPGRLRPRDRVRRRPGARRRRRSPTRARRWIHVVDLDAARTGEPVNRPVDRQRSPTRSPVARGSRPAEECAPTSAAAALADAGVARVVIGTAALEDPPLVARIAARQPVAVGLDARHGEVALRGWLDGSGEGLLDVAAAVRRRGRRGGHRHRHLS